MAERAVPERGSDGVAATSGPGDGRPPGPLRRGWTTGACATAATAAAYSALLTGRFPDPVRIALPGGVTPSFALTAERLTASLAEAAVTKDAGDDPDVTHGLVVWAAVRHGAPGSGVTFHAGPGVGTVTRAGLPLPVGEPAINPVPRRLMGQAVARIAAEHGAGGDAVVEISIERGEEVAHHTRNPRLGILGGLSVLGTTGVVVPYSCSAWIDSIRRGVDVARAAGRAHVAGCTGRTSEAAARREYGLADDALLDMGDFAGALLKYLRRRPVRLLTIAGGFGKLVKLGAGCLDLHSGRSSVDLAGLAALVDDPALAARIEGANTALEALGQARAAGVPLGDLVAERARQVALDVLAGAPVEVEVLVVDRSGDLAGRSRRSNQS
jgi:cobalt-precorrin-5B (C1)-methyltransferase